MPPPTPLPGVWKRREEARGARARLSVQKSGFPTFLKFRALPKTLRVSGRQNAKSKKACGFHPF